MFSHPPLTVTSLSSESVAIRSLLTSDQQRRRKWLSPVLDYKRGSAPLYTQGDEAKWIYFIDEGVVRLTRCGENGKRSIVAFRLAGDVLGFPASRLYENTAEAVCAAKVVRCQRQEVQQLMLAEPQFLSILLAKVANELHQAERHIMMLARQNVCQRLAAFIVDFISLPEFFDRRRSCLKLPLNRFDIADYLGTAPETTARAFSKLESEHLINRLSARTVEILDMEGLHDLQCGRRRGHRQN